MSILRNAHKLSQPELKTYHEIYDWFSNNLDTPEKFTRSKKPHAENVALSWFKDTATEHVSKMYQIAKILEAHGFVVEVIRTEKPGYIVFEDTYQVAAEPFKETKT